MKLVSACLAGVKCRYDGKDNYCNAVVEMVKKGDAIPVCPEQLGGMPTPRPAVELRGGKVIREDGTDMTSYYRHGAEEAMYLARRAGCDSAILKARSPTCGCGQVYDGSFSKTLVEGDGLLAELLKKNGINVITEKDITSMD